MDELGKTASNDARIDTRILKHLLREATDLLEEAQTHALIEKQGETTAYVLARANWRMTATCLWAMGELFPVQNEDRHSTQLHAPTPIFSSTDAALSSQLRDFVVRVDRLHERARRLDELSRGPTVSSAAPVVASAPKSASVVPLFGEARVPVAPSNAIEQARSRLRLAMAGLK